MKLKQKKNNYLLYISNILLLFGFSYLIYTFYPILKLEYQYQVNKWKKVEYEIVVTPEDKETKKLSSPSIRKPITIIPKSTEFGLIIEDINVNAFVEPNVDATTKEGYWKALENGVAHARGTTYPGQIGNTYLFAHSTVDPLNINKYNAVFTLLYKLEKGDRISTFYKGTRYDYYVESKEIVEPTNVEPLTKTYDEPVLTLQTCHPPGTNFKRLVVIAKMLQET